jgi:exosortase D (VPLPA-CTERM-specific)
VLTTEKVRDSQFPAVLVFKMISSASNLKKFSKPLIIAAALAFLYANVLVKLGRDWWTDENYSHGLLVPFLIGYIVYLEFDNLKNAVGKPLVRTGLTAVLLALAMLLGGTLGAELFTQRISLILMLAGIVIYFFGAKILKLLVVPFVLLLLAIPIPQIVFNKIAFPLQIYASQMAIWGIRLFELPSVRKGNVIEILPSGATQVIALEVVEACSGIRSLMTLVTLGLVLAYFTGSKRRLDEGGWFDFLKNFDFWRAVILMLAAIPFAILTNAARVTATGVFTYHFGRRATEGFWHDLSGWLVYIAALALLLLLNFGLNKIKQRKSEAAAVQRSQFKLDEPFASNQQYSTWILIGVLLTGGISINWVSQRGEATIERQSLSNISTQIGDWRQKGNEIRFDEATEAVLRTSDYTMREYVSPKNRLANLYVGYYASQRTGATYHSPQNCLPGAGWVMKQPALVEIKTPQGKNFTANKFIIENGAYNEVLIYWYQGRGRATASEYKDKINTVWDSILHRRSDGAMVRIMTSVGNSEAAATEAAIDLAAQTADTLPAFVPE